MQSGKQKKMDAGYIASATASTTPLTTASPTTTTHIATTGGIRLMAGMKVPFRGQTAKVIKIDSEGTNVRVQPLSGGKPVWCPIAEIQRNNGSNIDPDLRTITFHLRSKDHAQITAWREMLHDPESPALKGLSAAEVKQIHDAFVLFEGDIFSGVMASGSASAVVSPANSFGDMTGMLVYGRGSVIKQE